MGVIVYGFFDSLALSFYVTAWSFYLLWICGYTSMAYIDLHTHSNASDGSDSPAELVNKAADIGLAALALTDHDTVAGLPEACSVGAERGVEIIRGCELSAHDAYGEVHILGLWLPLDLESFAGQLARMLANRGDRNQLIVEKLCALGLGLRYEDVLEEAAGEAVGRPHIAKAMIRAGHVSSAQEAFARYLRTDAAAYVPKQTIPAKEGIEAMRSLGATVALAHPMLLRCSHELLKERIFSLREWGLDCIEAYHSEHSSAGERFCVDIAHKLQLGICGGSDYHGKAKPAVELGRGRGSLRVTMAVLDALKSRRCLQGLAV